jgi:hypothetical protein
MVQIGSYLRGGRAPSFGASGGQMEPTDGGKWSGGTLVASVTRAKRYEGKGEERRKKGPRAGGLNCLSYVNRSGVTQSRHLLWRECWPHIAR